MACSRFFFSTTLLLLFSLSIASATTDYVNQQIPLPNNKPNDIPKPNLDDQLNKPKDYTNDIPKSDFEIPHEIDDLTDVPKQHIDKSKPDGYGVVPKQGLGNPKVLDTEKLLPTCIEGLVLCKQGQKFTPIKGAKAKITCFGSDENDYETTESVLSPATDDKGYYFATLPISKLGNNLMKLIECKAYIQDSPLETCKVPTDTDNGISGAPLDTYRILQDKKIKLYRVKPFVFIPEPQPKGY